MPRLGRSKHHRSKSPADSSRSSSPGATRTYKPTPSNVEDLKRLLLVEKRLAELNAHSRELRKDKATLQRTVLEFMKDNRVGDISLNGGFAIIRKETKRKEPMKMEYLEKGLARRFGISQDEAHDVIAQIKDSLQVSSKEVLQLKKPPKKKTKTN